jgi:hypothetical protein
MAGSLVTRWRTWRKERREERRQEMLERLGLQLERGGAPFAGGFVFKLVGLAILVAVLVLMFYFMTRGSTRDPTSAPAGLSHLTRAMSRQP